MPFEEVIAQAVKDEIIPGATFLAKDASGE